MVTTWVKSHRLCYEQVLESCNQQSQILLYLAGHPLLMYINFLYGGVLFISAFHSTNLGKGLIQFLAITFRAENSVSFRNVFVYLSIVSVSERAYLLSRHLAESRLGVFISSHPDGGEVCLMNYVNLG